MRITRSEIEQMDRIFRLNLINSIGGIKSANLVGSVNEDGITNLTIFSSATHIGSNPALIGIFMRPTEEVPRHTFENILSTGFYSLNSLQVSQISKGHQTSAKYPESVSEFEACDISEEWHEGFAAPFVKDSRIKVGLKLEEILDIKLNNTKLIIGSPELIIVQDGIMSNEGYIDHAHASIAAVGGLNTYYSVQKQAVLPYARPDQT